MIPANTICVSQEGPANALALNKDCTQVVIAGRNVFKVFSLGENEFSEVCNLRVGKNLNLNFSSIDVAWSTIEENTLATAATNGAVVVWNLGRSGRSKQEHVFSDHKRTVNKVSFHLTDPSLLISGSQDGMMKCFDLRMKEVARTFISNTESIRDVQFSPHSAHVFAAVSENGSAQLWDVRRHERCLQQFAAHSGPVFACDWHPEMPWLATASRDKTIKVWDIHAKPNLEHTIYTIASVGHVKWRPQKTHQVASCALVLDNAVHVWDVRRPHVPLATFAEHRDVTTAIAWLATPHSFLSTSRDCSLYRHRFSEAAHPVLWANPHALSISPRGDLAHAAPERPLPAHSPARRAPAPSAQPPPPPPPALGRKQPTAGSLSATSQAALERAFPGGASSVLTRYKIKLEPIEHNNNGESETDCMGQGERAREVYVDKRAIALVGCAKEYRIKGAPPHELAEHNAKVAASYNRPMVAHVWSILRLWTAARQRPPAPRRPPPAQATPRPAPPPPYSSNSCVEEEPLEEEEEWAETQFQYSGVLGVPTRTIYIPPPKLRSIHEDVLSAPVSGWVSAASAHYVDEEAMDWTLPEEAFPLRTAPPPPGPDAAPPAPPAPDHGPEAGSAPTPTPVPATELSSGSGLNAGGGGGGSSPGAASSPGGSSSSGPDRVYSQQASNNSTEEGEGGLSVRAGGGECSRAAPDIAPLIAAALRAHVTLGDVQTACAALLALHEHRNDLFPYIDESLQEQWLLGYIEILQRHKLWNQATEVIRNAWLSSVWSISQQSTSVAMCCGRCGRRTRPHAPCDRCLPRQLPEICSVCHQVVRGLYAWCQGCSHGGHLLHMRDWLQAHPLCPAGCGHHCQLG